MQATGIVTGLEREAQCFRSLPGCDPDPAVACHGPGPGAAADAAAALLARGCGALASCGFAGGLDPGLRPGDVIVAEAVAAADGSWIATDTTWRQALLSHLRATGGHRCVGGRLAGLDQPLLTIAEKAAGGRRLAASAVDMESTVVGRAAVAAGVPFLVVRVILDAADRPIPAWLAATLDRRGRPQPRRLLAGLATHLGDLPALLRLAGDERRALAALRRVALDAGPHLARP